MNKLFALTLSGAILPLGALAEGVTLTVEGLRNDRGEVLVAVFDQAEAFDRLDFDKVIDFAEIPAHMGQVVHQFPALTLGPYAIFLFHDENSDQDLNFGGTTLLEGLGASGAANSGDDPDFSAASFPSGPVPIKVHYEE